MMISLDREARRSQIAEILSARIETNHLFSVEAITDSNGNLVETYGYDSHGAMTIRNAGGVELDESAVGNVYGFTGRRLDVESGLYYFRARYFDVGLGRFISRDPLGYVDGMSVYRGYFVPLAIDPLGLFEGMNITGVHFDEEDGIVYTSWEKYLSSYVKKLEPIRYKYKEFKWYTTCKFGIRWFVYYFNIYHMEQERIGHVDLFMYGITNWTRKKFSDELGTGSGDDPDAEYEVLRDLDGKIGSGRLVDEGRDYLAGKAGDIGKDLMGTADELAKKGDHVGAAVNRGTGAQFKTLNYANKAFNAAGKVAAPYETAKISLQIGNILANAWSPVHQKIGLSHRLTRVTLGNKRLRYISQSSRGWEYIERCDNKCEY